MLEGMKTDAVLVEVLQERKRQEKKWGQQNHPAISTDRDNLSGGRGGRYTIASEDVYRDRTDHLAKHGGLTYMDILLEEVAEAAHAKSIQDLRKELIQTAAVAVAMIESLDRNELAPAVITNVLTINEGTTLETREHQGAPWVKAVVKNISGDFITLEDSDGRTISTDIHEVVEGVYFRAPESIKTE